jgi:predicted lipase
MGRVLMDLSEWATEEFTRRHKAIENAIYLIMFNKFGICNTKEIKDFAIKHNCALCYDTDKNFIGISVNNRWLYTPSGQTIGKKGKRWMIEKINKK